MCLFYEDLSLCWEPLASSDTFSICWELDSNNYKLNRNRLTEPKKELFGTPTIFDKDAYVFGVNAESIWQ